MLFLLLSQEAGVGGTPGRRVFPATATQGAGSEGHPSPAVLGDSLLNAPVGKGGALGGPRCLCPDVEMSSSGVMIRFGLLNTHLVSLPCFQRQLSSHLFSGLRYPLGFSGLPGTGPGDQAAPGSLSLHQLHSENSAQGQFLEWF